MRKIPLVSFSENMIYDLSELLNSIEFTFCAIIVDEHSQHYCYPKVKEALPKNHFIVKIESGEEHKNIETCQFIWEKLTEFQFDRKSLVINLGGGVITDMGGFCAATFKRGIQFINIPTTILAQVDASIGGKLGIDFNGLKNHVGMFKNPLTTVVNTDFLSTLPNEEVLSGKAEMLKHGLISSKTHWDELIQMSGLPSSNEIKDSILIKENITKNDPEEKGLRKILNFGHTIGHAVETYLIETGNKLHHGYCIALGMICESYISAKQNMLGEKSLQAICDNLLKNYQLPKIEESSYNRLLELMKQDKKNEGGRVKFVLLKNIGEATYKEEVETSLIVSSLDFYNSQLKNRK